MVRGVYCLKQHSVGTVSGQRLDWIWASNHRQRVRVYHSNRSESSLTDAIKREAWSNTTRRDARAIRDYLATDRFRQNQSVRPAFYSYGRV